MGIVTMRNRVTTEFRKIDNESMEFEKLKAERWHRDGRPVWEQTSHVDAAEQQARIEEGTPLPSDLGDEDQPYSLQMGDSGLDTGAVVRGRPTRAERAQSAGKAAEGYEAPNIVGGATLLDVESDQSEGGEYGDLKGKALDDELKSRDLSTSGSVAEKRQRLIDDDKDDEDDGGGTPG